MPRIENRFLELLEIKRRRDRKTWTYREIYTETGITPSALTRFAQQSHIMYDVATLARLCEFLECEPGDLLILIKDDEKGQVRALATV